MRLCIWRRLGGVAGLRTRRTGAGLELQDAEQHVADVLPVDGLVALPRRDEEAGAEGRLLLLRDVLEDLRVAQEVARTQVARDLQLAVDRDHADVAGILEQAQHPAAWVFGGRLVGGTPSRLSRKSRTVPDVERRRRRNDAAVPALGRGLLVEVDGVAVTHRVTPVGDGGGVDRVTGGLWWSLRTDLLAQAGGQIPLRLTLRRHARNISDEVSGNGPGAVAAAGAARLLHDVAAPR